MYALYAPGFSASFCGRCGFGQSVEGRCRCAKHSTATCKTFPAVFNNSNHVAGHAAAHNNKHHPTKMVRDTVFLPRLSTEQGHASCQLFLSCLPSMQACLLRPASVIICFSVVLLLFLCTPGPASASQLKVRPSLQDCFTTHCFSICDACVCGDPTTTSALLLCTGS